MGAWVGGHVATDHGAGHVRRMVGIAAYCKSALAGRHRGLAGNQFVTDARDARLPHARHHAGTGDADAERATGVERIGFDELTGSQVFQAIEARNRTVAGGLIHGFAIGINAHHGLCATVDLLRALRLRVVEQILRDPSLVKLKASLKFRRQRVKRADVHRVAKRLALAYVLCAYRERCEERQRDGRFGPMIHA